MDVKIKCKSKHTQLSKPPEQMRNHLIALNVFFFSVCGVLIYHLITHESDDEPGSFAIPSLESDFRPYVPGHGESIRFNLEAV
jgi:hypothetical protein